MHIAHDGLQLPTIGFGTYKLKGNEGADSVAAAIDRGYTLLDSAFNYENEATVAEGVRRSGAARENIIYTSKLPGRHQAYDDATVTIEESLYRTGFDYLDLYLIHWPNPRVGKYVEAWQAMIDAKERGLIRHIGVCNFLPEHLEELKKETGVVPEVNQVELHPYLPQVEQLAYGHANGIITEAWSPLRRGDLLQDPVITKIASAHDATPGQVVLAWHTARDVLAIPKAFSPERQAENLASLDLTLEPAEIEAITALGRPDGRINDQDPAVYEEF
ncbi:aldo/keto reductase [Ancrocorticia populi]|uniref:Aldo/keto reductase n=1 Tax=Ancrocorticia populi TaxID=2175228 RepID=A0A2V1K835_9ACTO|nr:aldo/keto reductase [Ancrocorticia populi]MDN6486945.1 aldo/keto reductase [Ancrocorticia sp.]PWF26376.1 aldo/keto reductase [Ancrocorticia populi]